jgi:hypothetical protein
MPLDAPPSIPLITEPSTFAVRAQDWVVWQSDELYPFLNEFSGLISLSTSATSTTSNTIGTGSKSFTVETGKGFIAGTSLSIARTSAPTNRMFCVVTSYDTLTGALVVTSQAFEGSGTFTDWSIAPAFNGLISDVQLTRASGQAFNESISTLASSATPDIWTNTSNLINYTGTTTATGFAAAPQAGVRRTLILAGAASFTAGANMLIDGNASGATATLAAGDRVTVIALTTTQFRVKIEKSGLASMVRLHTSNGYGSTNTVIRRFSTVLTNQGADITYADSATLGATFTINNSGVYSISYGDQQSTAGDFGLSLNSAQLTTSIGLITTSTRLAMATSAVNNTNINIPYTGYFVAGDVIRAHATGGAVGTAPDRTQFTISRVA